MQIIYWDVFCYRPECTSNIPGAKSHVHFLSLGSFIQGIRPGPRLLVVFRNKLIFYGELLAPRPTPKLEDHPLSAVRDCLSTIFAATLQNWRESPPSATWGRAMPWWQGTHLTWDRTHPVLPSMRRGSPILLPSEVSVNLASK
jgi:hypothetical protein